MGRGKIVIKKIENLSSRQVTFCKRRNGIFKKAQELSVLCEAKVGVIIFSSTGRLYEFSSIRMEEIISRYNQGVTSRNIPAENSEDLDETDTDTEKSYEPETEIHEVEDETQMLRLTCMRMMGKELDGLSFKDLQQMEDKLTEGIMSIKSKKEELLLEQVKKSTLREQRAMTENENLRKEMEEMRQNYLTPILVSNPKMDWRNSALKTINKPVDRTVSVADQENEQSADTSLRLASDFSRKRKAPKIETTNTASDSASLMA